MAEGAERSRPEAGGAADRAPDAVERFATALIQHGPANDRVYIMDPGSEAPEKLLRRAGELAEAGGYGKLFAKVPADLAPAFFAAGWRLEAFVPGLFSGPPAPENDSPSPGGQGRDAAGGHAPRDGLFIVKYLDPRREIAAFSPEHRQLMDVFARLLRDLHPQAPKPLPHTISIRPCRPGDAPQMARIFARIFSDYPFPVDDPAFIERSMGEGTDYLCAEAGAEGGSAGVLSPHDGGGQPLPLDSGSTTAEPSRTGAKPARRIVALASAERSEAHLYAEMTDFAVLPDYRGLGLAGALLRAMEKSASERGIRTAYTIARLNSPGMNAAFVKAGYRYGGTLCANTAMPEGLESMNVLYKAL